MGIKFGIKMKNLKKIVGSDFFIWGFVDFLEGFLRFLGKGVRGVHQRFWGKILEKWDFGVLKLFF